MNTKAILSGLLASLTLAAAVWAQPSLDRALELFSEGDFQQSATMYEALTKDTSSAGAAWYGLARARHEGGEHASAVKAYEKALEMNVNPGRTQYHFARLLASTGKPEAAVRQIRDALEGAPIPYQTLANTAEFQPLADREDFQGVLESAKPCTDPEYRHFDFWVGEWDVTVPGGQPAGRSRVSRIQGDCVLLEEWTSATGGTGTSFNTYNQAKGGWQQYWVDSQGTVLEIAGGLVDGAMVMSSDPEASPVNRITWTPNDDGSVRQHWETSSDGGQTWSTAFDGTYRKR